MQFIITETLLDQMRQNSLPEYNNAIKIFRDFVKDEQTRTMLIFIALLRAKVERLSFFDKSISGIEDKALPKIDSLSLEELVKFYEIFTKKLSTETKDILDIINLLSKETDGLKIHTK